MDLFEQLGWLAPVDQWHPDAPALVEEARELSSLVPGDFHRRFLDSSFAGR